MKNLNEMTREEKQIAGFNWLITRSAESEFYTTIFVPGQGMRHEKCLQEVDRINRAIKLSLTEEQA